jgi:hypothetical protein
LLHASSKSQRCSIQTENSSALTVFS